MSADEKDGEASAESPGATEDERRAAAAAANRKRATQEWEENKKKWRRMGVPPALPAAGSMPKKP